MGWVTTRERPTRERTNRPNRTKRRARGRTRGSNETTRDAPASAPARRRFTREGTGRTESNRSRDRPLGCSDGRRRRRRPRRRDARSEPRRVNFYSPRRGETHARRGSTTLGANRGRERSGRIGSDRIESIGREDKPQNELIDDSRLKPFFRDPALRPSVGPSRTDAPQKNQKKNRTEPVPSSRTERRSLGRARVTIE